MDITSIIGVAALAGLVAIGVYTREIPAYFFNLHALAIVIGGSAAAMLINSPLAELGRAAAMLRLIFFPGDWDEAKAASSMVALSERVRASGFAALRDVDGRMAGGFLLRAATAAADYNDAALVERVLIDEINTVYDRDNETVNVYRTLAVLAPMFGLLGTLIGIVSVLKEISNAESVGKAMAVAMTTAFYGIALANAVCVPVAGKLRTRVAMQLRVRGIIAEGMVLVLKGAVPAVVERRLAARS